MSEKDLDTPSPAPAKDAEAEAQAHTPWASIEPDEPAPRVKKAPSGKARRAVKPAVQVSLPSGAEQPAAPPANKSSPFASTAITAVGAEMADLAAEIQSLLSGNRFNPGDPLLAKAVVSDETVEVVEQPLADSDAAIAAGPETAEPPTAPKLLRGRRGGKKKKQEKTVLLAPADVAANVPDAAASAAPAPVVERVVVEPTPWETMDEAPVEAASTAVDVQAVESTAPALVDAPEFAEVESALPDEPAIEAVAIPSVLTAAELDVKSDSDLLPSGADESEQASAATDADTFGSALSTDDPVDSDLQSEVVLLAANAVETDSAIEAAQSEFALPEDAVEFDPVLSVVPIVSNSIVETEEQGALPPVELDFDIPNSELAITASASSIEPIAQATPEISPPADGEVHRFPDPTQIFPAEEEIHTLAPSAKPEHLPHQDIFSSTDIGPESFALPEISTVDPARWRSRFGFRAASAERIAAGRPRRIDDIGGHRRHRAARAGGHLRDDRRRQPAFLLEGRFRGTS